MTSKISYSKISFYKIAVEDFRHKLWMLALSCLGSFLALPVAFLMSNRSYMNRSYTTAAGTTPQQRLQYYYNDFFTSDAVVLLGIVLTIGALVAGIWGFRYLYSRKMVDLYHSAPVKRGRMFFTVYINGLIIWLLPMLAAMMVTLLLVFANMVSVGAVSLFGSVAVTALKLLSMAVFCFLCMYHLFLVCVMISGNAFNAFYTSILLGTGVGALYGTFYLLSDAFLDTFIAPAIGWDRVLWASPLVGPYFLLNDFSSSSAGAYLFGVSQSICNHPYILRIGTFLVMLFNLWMAHRLYLKRPSELAEHGVDHKRAQGILRISFTITAALYGAMVFLWILDKDATAWQIFGLLLCGCLAFGITDIILHMNFRSFFAHKLQMVITLAVSCLLFLIPAFDLTGFDSRVPAKDSIESTRIYLYSFTDGSYPYSFTEDKVLYSSSDRSQGMTFENIDLLYPLLEKLTDKEHREAESWSGSIIIYAETSFGSFNRQYHLLDSDIEVLRPIVESEEYLQAFYPASCGLFPQPDKLNIATSLNYTSVNTDNAEQIQEILSAYYADFQDHTALETLNCGISVASLSMLYPYTRTYSNVTSTFSIDLEVYTGYTRTISKLKEYFPDMVLEKDEMKITSLEITVEENFDTIFDVSEFADTKAEDAQTGSAQDSELAEENVTVTANATIISPTAETIDQISITDPDELNQLLPLLLPGDYRTTPFRSLREYTRLGYFITTSGHTVSCYVRTEDLPLQMTESVKEYYLENR